MQHPGQAVRLRSSARTHTGRVRDNNEDNVHLWAQNDRLVVATVADGMGGAVAGEEASRIAVEAIRSGLANFNNNHPDAYETIDDDTIIAQLKYAIRNGNNNIIEYANMHPEMKGMGTTLTMAFIRGTQAIIGHVGDSRAYLVDGNDGHVIQITADHCVPRRLQTLPCNVRTPMMQVSR
jgi:serine/threonine protein phosphatase PrpC